LKERSAPAGSAIQGAKSPTFLLPSSVSVLTCVMGAARSSINVLRWSAAMTKPVDVGAKAAMRATRKAKVHTTTKQNSEMIASVSVLSPQFSVSPW
jgi:hypothetical protein